MKALVTGAAGFIGSNLSKALVARGDSVTSCWESVVGPTRSNSRVPSPRSSGDRWMRSSSTSLAARLWSMMFAPPMTTTSLSPAVARAWSMAAATPSVTHWNLDATRTRVWNLYKHTPPPLGYDPGGINVPGWQTPTSPGFVALRLQPWRLRVLPGEVFRKSGSSARPGWSDQAGAPR